MVFQKILDIFKRGKAPYSISDLAVLIELDFFYREKVVQSHINPKKTPLNALTSRSAPPTPKLSKGLCLQKQPAKDKRHLQPSVCQGLGRVQEDLGLKNYFVTLLALVHKGKHWLKGEEIKMIRSFKASQMVEYLSSQWI